MNRIVLFPFIFCLFCFSGCSGGLSHYPVKGKAYYGEKLIKGGNDKPGYTAQVIFHPNDKKDNKAKNIARGNIDGEGNFELVSEDGQKGTPPGWYKVTVMATEPSDPKNEYSPPKFLVPEIYSQKESSGVDIEVVSGKESYEIKFKK